MVTAVGAGAALDAWDEVPFAVLGVLSAWAYLRFLQEQPDGTRGDGRDSFALSSFFPRVMQPMARACAEAPAGGFPMSASPAVCV